MSKTVTVTKNLNVRRSPDFSWPAVTHYSPGATVNIKAEVTGKDIWGNSVWYQLEDGNYVWSGGTSGSGQAGGFAQKCNEFANDSYCKTLLLDANGNPAGQPNWKVSWGHIDTEIWKVWKQYNTMGQGVKVGVIDNGFRDSGNDLAGRIKKKTVSVGSDIFDPINYPHGTWSAGVIGASGANVLGVAPQCDLYVYKIDDPAPGAITLAIKQAMQDGVKIISISMDCGDNNATLAGLIDKYGKNGDVLFVASAGNTEVSSDPNYLSYPASHPGCLSVSGYCLDNNNSRQYNSDSMHNKFVALCGPGRHIRTASPTNAPGWHEGTSAACAFVAGMLALIVAKQPSLNYTQLMQKLASGKVTDSIIKSTLRSDQEGYGILNISKFLNATS